MKKLLAKIRKILKDRRTRQLLTRIVSVTAAIVVFVTTYALVLPAITMETEAQCGIPAHQHDDSCYEEILTCEIPESEGHHHTEDCYTTKQELDCKVEEHQHGADCYDADGNLVCGLTEHTHSVDNGCYEEVRELTCEIPESDGHQHDSSCYEKVLTCGKEVHTHSAECYSDSTTADTEYAAVEISSGGGTSAAAASTGNAEAGVDNAASGTGTAESAGKALTIVDNAEAGITEDGHYVPELAPINFSTVLDNHTGIYYHAVEDGEVIEDSTALTYDKWNRVKDNTELGTADLLRVYLAYTIPAGALNPTNPVARYRLPGNLHLSDAQVKAISETVNGIASQYVNMDTLEILDTEKYYAYLGIEAVEGTRTPIDDPDKYLADISRKTGTTASEYISATIRAENVYDEQSGELTAQDLVFTWTPYTIEKNQHEYDSTGNPTKAGEEISGWLSLDFNLSQVDFPDPDITTFERKIENETETDQAVENHSEEEQSAGAVENTAAVETVEHREQTADIIFVEEGRDENNQKIHEISTTLTVVEEIVLDTHVTDDQTPEDTIRDGETVDGTEESDEPSTGETADAADADEAIVSAEDDNKESADPEANQVIMPAMSFNDSITVRTGKPADVEENAGGTVANAADALPEKAEVTVRVEADEGTFPAGTTMKLKAVDNLDDVAKAVAETVENPTDTSSDSTDSTESTDAADSVESTESSDAVDMEKSDPENKQSAEEAQQDQNEKPEEEKDKSTVEGAKNLKTYGVQAVDITFVDAEGNEVEPAKPVRVALTSAAVEQVKEKAKNSAVTDPVVIHVDDEGNAEQMELVAPEEIEPAQGKTEEELLEEIYRETDKQGETETAADTRGQNVDDTAEDNMEFQTDSFSVYAIVYTVELYTKIITDSGETYRITVTYDETSGIPQDAELKVKEIKEDDEGYDNYFTEAVRAAAESSDVQEDVSSAASGTKADDGKSAADSAAAKGHSRNKNAYARFFDIEIWSDGQKIEPSGDVSVSIRLLDVPENDDKHIVKIIHFADDGTEVMPHTEDRDDEGNKDTAENQREDQAAVDSNKGVMEFDFTANTFSVYSVVSYTVDFHWEVDGKIYKLTLSGGDSISLSELINVLGVIKKDPVNQENEPAKDDQNVTVTANTLSIKDKYRVTQFIKDIEKVEFSNESLIKTIQITENVKASDLKKQFGLEIEYSAELTEEQIAEIEAKQFIPPDWALMVLKHFDTEESLTITMQDGEVWIIRVTDPVTDTRPSDMQVLPTVDTRSQGIKMWLFDYDLQGLLDHQDNKANQLNWNIPNTYDEAHQYGNYGINSGSDLKFLGWGAGNAVKSYESAGNSGFGINDFTGLDEKNTNRIRALQGIVQNELVNDYPVLQDGTSLAYLFDPTLNTADRAVYGGTTKESGNITGLFELDNQGYYIYDSDEHYAELKKNGNNYTNNFTVYTSTLAQTNKDGGNHDPVRAVGFFPFDSYSHVYNDLKYERDGFHYDDYGTMYVNPDGDQGKSGLNHHLGVAMEMDFVMPKGGKTEGGDPIQFKFSGDDDMWVFIDDQLVLDIGGLHQPVDGVIDFSTGKATITGKATVSGHSDNTGSNAIGVVQNVTDNRGNNFAFYPSLGLTDGDGKTHTMKIFYMERGGCDSNCMISFNLPLVKGKGDVTIAKYDSTATPVVPLSGVKFGIYSDPQCTDLIEEVTSNSNGLLDFSDLGIKNDDQKYYIKETKPLPGYKSNDTIYTLKVKDNGSNGYTFGVYVYNQEGVYTNEIETIGEQPARPVIYNEERQPIDLTVEKVWQEPTMEDFTPTEDDNLSATFKAQRYIRSEGDRVTSQPVTFKVYRIKGSNSTLIDSEVTLKGKSKVYVNWDYRASYVNYDYSNRYNKYKYNTTGGSYSTKPGTGPLEITLPDNGTANIYIRDEDYGTTYGNGVLNITVNGTPYDPQNATEHFSTDWVLDNTYNNADACPKLTLPEDSIDEDHPWKGEFSNLPLYSTEGDTTHYYKYYIIEADSIDGYETIYMDGNGSQIGNPSNLATAESNTSSPQKVINRKLIDIPVEKYWPDYSGEEYTWTAKLQLDYRNVPLDDPEHPGNWDLYSPSQIVEVSKSDTQQKFFTGLPMYYTDSAGRQYRREYSIIETAYKVTRIADGHVVAQYDEADNIIPPIAHRYTPWYIHDAGEVPEEGTVGIDDYSDITVQNMLQQPDIEKQMTLDITKNWQDNSYLSDPDAKAVFQLKRYVITEYRNYEGQAPITNWVEITLDTGTGHNQKIKVPQNTTMYIRGYLKEGKEGDIRFSSGISPNSYHVVYDSSNQGAFSIEFIADTSKTITLASGTNNGADLVIGGADGFRLSETNSIQSATIDNSFCIEFELSNDKGWSKHFPETSQESHDNQNHDSEPADMNVLPVIEVSILDDLGLTANTYVYRYFLEEVSSQPVGFNATFTDGNGNELLGDIGHQIYFDTTIKATNRPTGLDILKEDIDQADRTLPGAIFQLRKLDDGPEGTPPVAAIGGTYTGKVIQPNAEETDSNGKQTFKPDAGLEPGYYELTELKAPDGYVLTADPTVFIKVENLGVIKLLKKDESGAVLWDQVADEGELVGNASISTSVTAADGKTITFTVRNEPGVELPSAGGPGTKVIYLAGALLTLFGVVMLWKRKIKV